MPKCTAMRRLLDRSKKTASLEVVRYSFASLPPPVHPVSALHGQEEIGLEARLRMNGLRCLEVAENTRHPLRIDYFTALLRIQGLLTLLASVIIVHKGRRK